MDDKCRNCGGRGMVSCAGGLAVVGCDRCACTGKMNPPAYIRDLEAVVRALDDAMRHATAQEIAAVLDLDRGLVWGKLVAARSRVNLPEIPDSSPSSQAGLDNSMVVEDGFGDNFVRCGHDCSGHFARPGSFQCNRDGANCPNKEASE